MIWISSREIYSNATLGHKIMKIATHLISLLLCHLGTCKMSNIPSLSIETPERKGKEGKEQRRTGLLNLGSSRLVTTKQRQRNRDEKATKPSSTSSTEQKMKFERWKLELKRRTEI